MIQTKSIYDQKEESYGMRILITRHCSKSTSIMIGSF
jgi:uncharacterized protein YeaO (DUF488 family)